jgi:hypothetical protein
MHDESEENQEKVKQFKEDNMSTTEKTRRRTESLEFL